MIQSAKIQDYKLNLIAHLEAINSFLSARTSIQNLVSLAFMAAEKRSLEVTDRQTDRRTDRIYNVGSHMSSSTF